MGDRNEDGQGRVPSDHAGHNVGRRDLLKGIAGIGLATSLTSGVPISSGPDADGPRSRLSSDLVRKENQRPGTRDWLLSRTRIDPETRYRSPAIEGFCSRTSVRPGQTLEFHVSTNPVSRFTIDIFRMGYYGGSGGRLVTSIGPLAGKSQPDPPVGPNRVRDCQWEASASLKIPSDWLSGVYVGKLTAEKDGVQSYVIFVVRDDRQADFLFQCSDTTWQAYNYWPSEFSLYRDGQKQGFYWGPDVAVSFNRPYAMSGQIVRNPLTIGSGEFFSWEFPLAFWMESRGYDVTYISNLDTHSDPAGLTRAKGFLSVGHDEYYTIEMYRHLKQSIADGLNIAFLSGNVCYGQIAFSDSAASRIFSRLDCFGRSDPREFDGFPEMKRFPFRAPSERSLVGAHSVYPVWGGSDWTCVEPEHWIFAGTGMQQGDAIPGLVGWEWHGEPAEQDRLVVLASGPIASPRDEWSKETQYTATIYNGPKGNFVFNASTCWWSDGLAEPPGYVRPRTVYAKPQGPDSRVGQITANVLERMRS
ncbi:MAG: N,N-dimethylformamidase beta subunit family domain-containing protein [Woeseiaceae bacterium]